MDRRPDARPGRPDVRPTPRFLDRYAARLPELAARREPRASRAASRSLARDRRCDRACSPCARRPRRGPGRRARPDDRHRRPLRRPARRSTASGSRVDMVLTNHLKDTDDQALLLRPGVPGRPARHVGLQAHAGPAAGRRDATVSKRTATYTLAPARSRRRACTAASRRRTGCVFDLVDPGGAADPRRPDRRRRSSRSRSGRSPPTRRRAARSGSSSRPASRSRSSRATIPAPTTDADGQGRLPDRQARRAADVLRLPRRRSAGAPTPTGPSTVDVGGDAGRADDPGLARRRGVVEARRRARRRAPCRCSPTRIGLPLAARRRAGRPRGGRAARPAATPGCSTRPSGQIEVAYYADDGVVLHEAAHAWFNGALLADRWANEAFASYYGLEVAGALKVKAGRRRP